MGKRTVRYGTFETNSSSMHSVCVMKEDGRYTDEELREGLYVWKEGYVRMYSHDLYFGRHPFQMLCTFYDKLRYVIAAYCGGARTDSEAAGREQELAGIVKKYVPEFTAFKFDTQDFDIYEDEDGNELTKRDLEYACQKHYQFGNDGDVYDCVFACDVQFLNDPDVKKRLESMTKRNNVGYFYRKNGGDWKIAKINQDDVYEVPIYGEIDHQSMGMLERFIKEKGISIEDFLMEKRYIIVIDGDEYCDFDKYCRHHIIDTSRIEEVVPEIRFEEEDV